LEEQLDVKSLVLSLTDVRLGVPGQFLEEMFQEAMSSGRPQETVPEFGVRVADWIDQVERFDQLSIYARGVMLYHLQQHWDEYARRETFEDVSFDTWSNDRFGTNWRMWVTVSKKWVLNMDHSKWVENIPLQERLTVPPSKAHRMSRQTIAEGLDDRQMAALFDEHVGDHQFRAILNTTEEDDEKWVENGSLSYEYSHSDQTFYVWSGNIRKPALRVISQDPDIVDFVEFLLEICHKISVT